MSVSGTADGGLQWVTKEHKDTRWKRYTTADAGFLDLFWIRDSQKTVFQQQTKSEDFLYALVKVALVIMKL